jgi:hypothetical protein
MTQMAKFPLRVKTRDSTGAEIEVLCDTAESALGNARHLRGTGHAYVWIEDVDGRLVDEKSLYA